MYSMNRLVRRTPQICQTYARGIGMTEARGVKFDLTKLKKKQAEFQMQSDVPVHLRGGLVDRISYYLIVGFTLIGLGMSFQALYQLAKK